MQDGGAMFSALVATGMFALVFGTFASFRDPKLSRSTLGEIRGPKCDVQSQLEHCLKPNVLFWGPRESENTYENG